MAGYVVKGAAVVLPTKGGSERYLYRGAPVDADAYTDEGIKHALDVGLIAEATDAKAATESKPVEIPEGEPSKDWTVAQLDAYAQKAGIDLGQAKNKDDKIAAIEAAKAPGA